MKASTTSFRAAVLFAMAGVLMGIAMAASHDHTVKTAHAHLNLLGWVSLFLIGIFYRLHPVLDRTRLAAAQVAVWIVGTTVLTIGVAGIYLGYSAGEPVAIAGSFTILAGLLLFAFLVFRPAPKEDRGAAGLAPAE